MRCFAGFLDFGIKRREREPRKRKRTRRKEREIRRKASSTGIIVSSTESYI